MGDIEILANLAEVQPEFELESKKALECIIDSYFMVAVLRKGDAIIGFRLYDMHYDITADYSYASVEQRVRENSVRIENMAWLDDAKGARLACTQGSFDDYTQLDSSGTPLSGYRPLVCIGRLTNFIFVDYKGGISVDIRQGGDFKFLGVGVANLLATTSSGEKDKSRCPMDDGEYNDIDYGFKATMTGFSKVRDVNIYTSDQCNNLSIARFYLKTIWYNHPAKEFQPAILPLNNSGDNVLHNVGKDDDIAAILEKHSESMFIYHTGSEQGIISGSGACITNAGDLSKNVCLAACYPLYRLDLVHLLVFKRLPLYMVKDVAGWQNFLAINELSGEERVKYLGSHSNRYGGNTYYPGVEQLVQFDDVPLLTLPKTLSIVQLSQSKEQDFAHIILSGTTFSTDLSYATKEFELSYDTTSAYSVIDALRRDTRQVRISKVSITGITEYISSCAFRGAARLKVVELPDSVRILGMSCFENCSSLEKINLPTNLEGIGQSAFCSCGALEEITIPEGTKYIGAQAFAGCISLKSLVIPASVEVIHRKAFADCSGIANIVINGNPLIESSAFNNCNPTVLAVVSQFRTFNELKEADKEKTQKAISRAKKRSATSDT